MISVNKSVAIAVFLAVAAASSSSTHAHAQDDQQQPSAKVGLERVNISIQPAFHAIPVYTAFQYGWFEGLGLDVTLSLYSAGGPQVQDAVNNQTWDFGIAGSVPGVIAGQQNILTIGINNDESATTEVVGAPSVTSWPPTQLYDGIFEATKDSTGELLLRKCLDAAGIDFNDTHIKYDTQGDILDNLKVKETSFGSLWAPNTYTYRDAYPNDEAQAFCNGKTIDFPILGGLMVREEFAKDKPDTVAKILAAYLRGVTLMQNAAAVDEVLQLSMDFHHFAGVPIPEQALEEDLFLRPLFNLDGQLDAMSRNQANDYISELDTHYMDLEQFLLNHGVIEQKYEPREYITHKYMKMVSEDPWLRDFAYAGSTSSTSPTVSSSSSSTDSSLSGGDVVGIVVGVFGALCLIVALVLVYQLGRDQSSKVDVSRSTAQEPKLELEPAQDSTGFNTQTV
jgi:ABC-type nitrate/sulfonate/bicarbonate transport system substrate-binding protein